MRSVKAICIEKFVNFANLARKPSCASSVNLGKGQNTELDQPHANIVRFLPDEFYNNYSRLPIIVFVLGKKLRLCSSLFPPHCNIVSRMICFHDRFFFIAFSTKCYL